MKRILKWFYLYLYFCCFLSQSMLANVVSQDSLALVDLYNSTNGGSWTYSTNWLTGVDVNHWYGITVANHRVVKIELWNNNPAGTLPASIGNLDALTKLQIHHGQIGGPIPATIGNLSNLTELQLSNQLFNGELPTVIGNLTNLTHLLLYGNQLSGAIKPELGNLSNLHHLALQWNQFSGSIPPELGQLSNLSVLGLNGNQLTGHIPPELGNLVNLSWLFLNDNQLEGTLSASFGQLVNLGILDCSNNLLSGALPAEMANMANLNTIWFAHNQLEDFPDISALQNVNDFRLENNKFTFEDLEPNANVSSHIFTCSPQDSIGKKTDTLATIGIPFTLSVNTPGTANTYVWYKDGNWIPNSYNSTYTIPSFSEADVGKYQCNVGNNLVSQLVLSTRTIRVRAEGVFNPLPDELFVAGEKDTIEWLLDGERVNLSLSLDDGNTFSETIATNILNNGEFIWNVPGNLLSRKCIIKVENAASASEFIYSNTFKIKGYILTRLTQVGQFEAFDFTEDKWNFLNKESKLWPQSWWQRYNYQTGNDPNTSQIYPDIFRAPFVNAKPKDSPSWEIWVKSFGLPECYHQQTQARYKIKAIHRWKKYKKKWWGSCLGMSVSSFMAFDDKDNFLQKYPQIGQFSDLNSLQMNDDRREVINLIHPRQFGKDQFAVRLVHYQNKKPKETLKDLMKSLLKDKGDSPVLSFWHNNGSGGHTVAPFKVLNHSTPNSPKFDIWIYDSNDTVNHRIITVDTLQDKWSASNYPNWGGADRLILEAPASLFYSAEIGRKSVEIPGTHCSQSAGVSVFNTPDAHISIVNPAGQKVGFADSLVISEIPGSIPIIPTTGGYHPPIGYHLPGDQYSVEVSHFSDSAAYLAWEIDSISYNFARLDAVPGQTDQFELKDGMKLKNPDSETKTINMEAIISSDTSDKYIGLHGLAAGADDSLKCTITEGENLKAINWGSDKIYNLVVQKSSASEYSIFEHQQITLAANSSHHISPEWENLLNQSMRIRIDNGNNGTIDDSITVNNQHTGLSPEIENNLPKSYQLSQNYPNPFNNRTRISYLVPKLSHVKIEVFNLLGQRVKILIDEVKVAGSYHLSFDASAYPSGIYYYRMAAEDFSEVKKMIMLK